MGSIPQPTPGWQELAKSKRDAAAARIPKDWLLPDSVQCQYVETSTLNVLDVPRTCGILTAKELDITENYDATDLVALMSAGKLTSVDVVTAFCKRAAIAQQCTKCLTEIMFKEAMARAHEIDAYLAQHGKPIGPLHGLPISLKDSFNVKGFQATIAYVSFINHPPATSNSAVVDLLANAGAVFYCKTNLPQTMMAGDSHNNIWGRTLNPHNLSLTSGGSTGGEAALLAMKGSVLGLTTDIAGSNRIPALCCGVGSIKPTGGRIPFSGGAVVGRIGDPSPICPVIGPSGHSVRDFELLLKTTIDSQPWLLDATAMNLPWRSVQPVPKNLRFGLIGGDSKRPLHPPIARALHETAAKLKAEGHEIIPLDEKIPSVYETALLCFKFFMLDPEHTPSKRVRESGEPFIPALATATFHELKGWKPSLDALWGMYVERAKIVKKYHELFANEGLDAVLMCGYQAVAPKHDTYGVPLYTVVWNLLNYPAGILTCGKANKELDKPFFKDDVEYEPAYDADAFEGAPAHVQIVGKPFMDEELIEVMKVVEALLKGN